MEDSSLVNGDCFSVNELFVHDVVGLSKTLPMVGLEADDDFCAVSPAMKIPIGLLMIVHLSEGYDHGEYAAVMGIMVGLPKHCGPFLDNAFQIFARRMIYC
ncbi:hypothetical protein L6452_41344 [Arctium lappa]|uniref:Uncharacterized protein n=1 Tax=Arctium lappa TaxID=4217 RepID=A0ACB8XPA2_ARCLA|nr:hypothetical protein L6452_41344 [Arctium lappa]